MSTDAQPTVATYPCQQKKSDPQQQQQQQAPPPYGADPTGSTNYAYTPESDEQQQQQQQYPSNDDTVVDVGFTATGLENSDIRRAFIRKVYLILACQLAFTFGAVLLITLIPSVGEFIRYNWWLFYVSMGVFFVVYIGLVCSTKLRRQTPGNFIALCVFTVAMTMMAGTLAAFTSSNAVLVSMGITAGMCIGITLFVLQTRIDFTVIAGLAFAVMLVFILFGLSCLFTFVAYRSGYPHSIMSTRILDCVYGGLVALLLAVCLLIDTHRVIGGSGGYELSEEEYVFGALQLYIDIVYIFMIFLGMRGGR